MGCLQSKESLSENVPTLSLKQPRSIKNHGESRIETVQECKVATLGGIKIRYAYLSQRGYYPDDTTKPNQDAYADIPNYAGNPNDHFFGVFDGHGRDGEKCAQFAATKLPPMINKYINKLKTMEQQKSDSPSTDDIELTKDQIQAACLTGHVQCNRSMHKCNNFDDSLSGTTSISCYVHGRRNRITVSNVGDSRAILGQLDRKNNIPTNNGSVTMRALPLSRDQTPYRRDERKRILETGARILSLDQIEGLEPVSDECTGIISPWENDLELGEEIDEGGDPPRVWSPHGDYPGTAFTRSLGDVVAEELGVTAEPEMVTRELTSNDKIIVLASDGVFEFLTNQSVIDICAKFKDPLEACRAVVAESYELWLQYELRTDDITMVCIFIDSVEDDSSKKIVDNKSVKPDAPTDDNVDALPEEKSKPVRKYISKEKTEYLETMREKMTSDMGDDLEEDFDLMDLFTEKSDEDKALIGDAIKGSVIFQDIAKSQRELIYGVMEPIKVKKDDWIIRQGTVGDRFYVVDHGQFEVRIVKEGEEDVNGDGGNVVHVYNGSRSTNAHPCFGELALMYSAPRAASIIARTDGQLWALHRYAFKRILAYKRGLTEGLKTIDTFKDLDDKKLDDLISNFEEVTIGRGETIVTQGEMVDYFYLIATGSCEMVYDEDGKETKTKLKSKDHFGDEALKSEEMKYGYTVVTVSLTTFFKISKTLLTRFIDDSNI